MSYVEGFVFADPVANKGAFSAAAAKFASLCKDYGATRIVDAWGDDIPDGKLTDFRRAVKAEEDEVVAFSWIEYPSKAIRDAANAKMRDDPRMKQMDMPFDGKRMIFGGFEVVFDGK